MACVRRTGENFHSVGIEALAKPIFGRGLPLPMAGAPCARRINGDFTGPSGGRKNWHRQFFRRGQDPLSKITAQNCEAILLCIYREEMRDRFLRPSLSPSAYNSRSRDASLSNLPTVSGFSGRIMTARPSRSNCSARASALL